MLRVLGTFDGGFGQSHLGQLAGFLGFAGRLCQQLYQPLLQFQYFRLSLLGKWDSI